MVCEYSFSAPFYDMVLLPFLGNIRGRVLRIVKELNPERIVDLCCGTGSQLRLLKKHGFHGIGIDLSESMLKVAKRGVNAPDCLLRNATATGFKSGTFDLAMITFALHETGWENAHAILDECQRILRPGGHLLIVDYASGKGAPKMADRVVGLIEFLAGKDHYGNFIRYKQSGGLDALFKGRDLSVVSETYAGYRSIVVKVLRKGRTGSSPPR
ncbi:MAG: class I SAM-dependent methyltransferase [Deltaproteobacteria bacterium]|nr:class I SAM-dependent methyltransferase [Deltaproteobacteria bacterium]MBW2050441.1 class I SAM-dependent methyltransferase [Deltaproteobacteria bacterium]MBW2113139.1 class I SAM-dependent methyltransferase [Deltaproteobacteria bacterium]MBW2355133.1 class I SAM-dependent methyltransferase [Deltaproteobacteria bacterium]